MISHIASTITKPLVAVNKICRNASHLKLCQARLPSSHPALWRLGRTTAGVSITFPIMHVKLWSLQKWRIDRLWFGGIQICCIAAHTSGHLGLRFVCFRGSSESWCRGSGNVDVGEGAMDRKEGIHLKCFIHSNLVLQCPKPKEVENAVIPVTGFSSQLLPSPFIRFWSRVELKAIVTVNSCLLHNQC